MASPRPYCADVCSTPTFSTNTMTKLTFFAACAAALLSGCDTQEGQGFQDDLGYLHFTDRVARVELSADTIELGSPLDVTVGTFGSLDCVEPAESEVEVTPDTVFVRVRDRTYSGPCAYRLDEIVRTTAVTPSAPGEVVVRVIGRVFPGEGTYEIDRVVNVRP